MSNNSIKEFNLTSNIRIQDIVVYGDFVNYLINKAVQNIIKDSNCTLEDIFKEDYSNDNIYFRVSESFKLPKIEDYEDKFYLQVQLDKFEDRFIAQTETIIYSIIN